MCSSDLIFLAPVLSPDSGLMAGKLAGGPLGPVAPSHVGRCIRFLSPWECLTALPSVSSLDSLTRLRPAGPFASIRITLLLPCWLLFRQASSEPACSTSMSDLSPSFNLVPYPHEYKDSCWKHIVKSDWWKCYLEPLTLTRKYKSYNHIMF